MQTPIFQIFAPQMPPAFKVPPGPPSLAPFPPPLLGQIE